MKKEYQEFLLELRTKHNLPVISNVVELKGIQDFEFLKEVFESGNPTIHNKN